MVSPLAPTSATRPANILQIIAAIASISSQASAVQGFPRLGMIVGVLCDDSTCFLFMWVLRGLCDGPGNIWLWRFWHVSVTVQRVFSVSFVQVLCELGGGSVGLWGVRAVFVVALVGSIAWLEACHTEMDLWSSAVMSSSRWITFRNTLTEVLKGTKIFSWVRSSLLNISLASETKTYRYQIPSHFKNQPTGNIRFTATRSATHCQL